MSVNLFRAWYPARSLTSVNIIKLLSQALDIQCLYGVPFALKLLAETPEGLQVLKHLRLVAFSGSPCPDELGNFLVSEAVPLVDCGLSASFSFVFPLGVL